MYGLDVEDIQNIKTAIAKDPAISKVILYGSRAKGNYRNGSDIDLTLLGKDLTLTNSVYPLLDELEELYLPYTFDISVYRHINNDDLIGHINRVGKVFYRKEVGLPDEWEVKRFGEICENLDSKRIPITKAKRTNGDIPYYGASGIVDYVAEHIFDEDLLLISEDGANLFARTYPIAFTISGKSWVNNHAHVLRFNHRATQLFVEYFFNSISLEPYVSGMAQPKLNQKSLNSISVPLPPLPEQKRIVAILDKAFAGINQAVANAVKNLANGRELFESYLNTIFTQKGEEWVEKTLKDISVEFGRGKSKHRPRNDPKLYGGSYPFVQTGDVRNSTHLITEYSQTYNEEGLAQSKLWKRGTICITIAANIAETGILDFDACFPDSVIGIVVDERQTFNTYVEYLLQAMKARLKAKGKGSAQDNINLGTFKNEYFPFPSLKEQKKIISVLLDLSKGVHRLESIYQQKLTALQELKKSILQKAFTGKLTRTTEKQLPEEC